MKESYFSDKYNKTPAIDHILRLINGFPCIDEPFQCSGIQTTSDAVIVDMAY